MSNKKLTFVGMGLYDEKDISLKGLDAIKNCDRVFAEFYTSYPMGTSVEKLEDFFGKKIHVLDREDTESADKILSAARGLDVVFLCGGDSMTATTHVDLRLRAVKEGIDTFVIHSSSIVTAVPGLLGLQNYKFGRSTTLVYPEPNFFPTSPYDVIKNNQQMGLHTLILLDIKGDEKRYMTANEGLRLLLRMEDECKSNVLDEDSVVCVVARAGSDEPVVRAGCIKDLLDEDFGGVLHTLVFPGRLHFMEIEGLGVLAQLPAQQVRKLQKV